MKKHLLVHAVVTTMLGMSASAMAGTAAVPVMEKCYGVAKAGKNDCGTPAGNACAAQVKQDNVPQAWIYLPKGSCDKIVGGNLTAKAK